MEVTWNLLGSAAGCMVSAVEAGAEGDEPRKYGPGDAALHHLSNCRRIVGHLLDELASIVAGHGAAVRELRRASFHQAMFHSGGGDWGNELRRREEIPQLYDVFQSLGSQRRELQAVWEFLGLEVSVADEAAWAEGADSEWLAWRTYSSKRT